MTTKQHTQLPWTTVHGVPTLINSTTGHYIVIADVAPNGNQNDPEFIANADFIVRACNNHYELCYAIECFLQCFGDKEEKCISMAKEALKKAKGGL